MSDLDRRRVPESIQMPLSSPDRRSPMARRALARFGPPVGALVAVGVAWVLEGSARHRSARAAARARSRGTRGGDVGESLHVR